jgi:hypothetical protein
MINFPGPVLIICSGASLLVAAACCSSPSATPSVEGLTPNFNTLRLVENSRTSSTKFSEKQKEISGGGVGDEDVARGS